MGQGMTDKRKRALRFVLLVGVMSLFADFTYEGWSRGTALRRTFLVQSSTTQIVRPNGAPVVRAFLRAGAAKVTTSGDYVASATSMNLRPPGFVPGAQGTLVTP